MVEPKPVEVKPAPKAEKAWKGLKVGFSCRIRRTFDLDIVAQSYGTMLHILMKWESEDVDPDADDGVSAWEPDWIPRWTIKNVLTYIESKLFFSAEPHPTKKGTSIVYMEGKYLVILKQNMHLRLFPFDHQDFNVAFEMEATDSKDVCFVEYEDAMFDAPLPIGEADVARCGFDDMETVGSKEDFVTAEITETDRTKSRRKIAYSGVSIKMRYRRLAQYYLKNVALTCFCISSFAFSVWAIDSDLVAERLGVDFTLLLTAVAFKLVATSMLPKVNYFTKLDSYIMVCLIFLCVATAIHSLLPFFSLALNSPTADDFVDKYSLRILAAFWLGFNLYAAIEALRLMYESQHVVSMRKTAAAPKVMV